MNSNVETIHKIVIIGSGNLAFHLGKRLLKKGNKIIQVYSRNKETGSELAAQFGASFIYESKKIDKSADIYCLCTNDEGIIELSKKIKLGKKLVIHFSGSVEMNVLKAISSNHGVLYPLQTFSRERKIKWKNIPLLLEASNSESKLLLEKLSLQLSKNYNYIISKQRKEIHLAAVVVSNFTNQLLHLANLFLEDCNNKNFNLLYPLIEETIQKAKDKSPFAGQTGPAKRNDLIILKNQLLLLKKNPELSKFYSLFSESILNHHNRKNGKL